MKIQYPGIELSNLEGIPGRSIVEHYGVVSGSTVRAKHFGKDFMAGLKNIVGGELTQYTELLEESRTDSVRRMCEQAEQLGMRQLDACFIAGLGIAVEREMA